MATTTPGTARRRFDAVADQAVDAGGGGVPRPAERHAHGEHVRPVSKPGLTSAEGDGSADEQSGADQQDDGERDFADHQERAGFVLAHAGAAAAAAFLESDAEIGAGGSECGNESEQQGQ